MTFADFALEQSEIMVVHTNGAAIKFKDGSYLVFNPDGWAESVDDFEALRQHSCASQN